MRHVVNNGGFAQVVTEAEKFLFQCCERQGVGLCWGGVEVTAGAEGLGMALSACIIRLWSSALPSVRAMPRTKSISYFLPWRWAAFNTSVRSGIGIRRLSSSCTARMVARCLSVVRRERLTCLPLMRVCKVHTLPSRYTGRERGTWVSKCYQFLLPVPAPRVVAGKGM